MRDRALIRFPSGGPQTSLFAGLSSGGTPGSPTILAPASPRDPPENTIIVSPDNRSRQEIDQAVRTELQATGAVSKIVASSRRWFSVPR